MGGTEHDHQAAEPDFSAVEAALGEAAARMFSQGASADQVTSVLSKAIREGLTRAASPVLAQLERDAPAMLQEHHRERFRFERHLRGHWGHALDMMYSVIVSCGEVGEHSPGDVDGVNQAQLFALSGLHARAWQIAREIHLLLGHGYISGAMARARTMMELATVALVLSEHGRDAEHQDLAERFLAHRDAVAYKEAVAFNAGADIRGEIPFTDAELAILQSKLNEVVGRYGKSFREDYGWASQLVGKDRPRFADLERLAGLSHLRALYTWSSHAVHVDSRGFASTMISGEEGPQFLAGPSVRGLAEPAQITLNAFLQTTGAVLLGTAPAKIDALLHLTIIQRMIERTAQEFMSVASQEHDDHSGD